MNNIKIQCDKCGYEVKSTDADIREGVAIFDNGEELKITYLVCGECNHMWRIFLRDEEMKKLNKQLQCVNHDIAKKRKRYISYAETNMLQNKRDALVAKVNEMHYSLIERLNGSSYQLNGHTYQLENNKKVDEQNV